MVWINNRLEEIKPSRGLRQGDPLSPYLFVLCMEILGQRIAQIVEKKHWKLWQLGRGGLRLSHLFFVDDLLLLGEASVAQATVIYDILQIFCKEFGHRVNNGKSKIGYSPNTSSGIIHTITQKFEIPTTVDLEKYLGVSLIHGRLRSHHLDIY